MITSCKLWTRPIDPLPPLHLDVTESCWKLIYVAAKFTRISMKQVRRKFAACLAKWRSRSNRNGFPAWNSAQESDTRWTSSFLAYKTLQRHCHWSSIFILAVTVVTQYFEIFNNKYFIIIINISQYFTIFYNYKMLYYTIITKCFEISLQRDAIVRITLIWRCIVKVARYLFIRVFTEKTVSIC